MILLYANDRVGSEMAGPGIRYAELARRLAADEEVVLAVPFPTDAELDGVRVVHVRNWRELARGARGARAVFAQRLPLPVLLALRARGTRIVFDLYAPTALENVVAAGRVPRRLLRANLAAQRLALASGEAFACASERQRDLWLGALLEAGRITPAAYAADPSLRRLVDVVPFGIDSVPPTPGPPVLRGVLPGVGAGDLVLLWPGGVWDWTDPLVVARAVTELGAELPGLRLVFMGTTSPNEGRPHRVVAELRDLAGPHVILNEGWVAYGERGRWLLEADLGVSAHIDDVESRFAYRSRLLDCVWARLPVVATQGDLLGDLVGERGLGRSVAPGDVAGWKQAIRELLEPDAAAAARAALDAFAGELGWDRAGEALRRLLSEERSSRARTSSVLRSAVAYALDRGRRGA